MQIPGRSLAITEMQPVTLKNLSSGRFKLGFGVSGPQVFEVGMVLLMENH